ncbi:SDR family oxidoreductase [Saccharibacillus sp. CPCC 101409]|uniref:SDR family oxidoreductase n=1 Tax=Saccharibacillus sp. CPCC 101409 TaxID=3058041 RepID=UPI0026720C62|nr:SDR family oxidoreductase [Saccharibacillus sp. CPCC 101409]MDO3412425.1 SDR family oxidoreductase [Saccharibacillus sp. CPCC 101409]
MNTNAKTIMITGTSSGIGRAAAEFFADNGWNVAATMRSPERETELTRRDNVRVTALDVERADTIETAVRRTVETFGRIDVLLNNAGYGTLGLFEASSDEQIRRQFDVNVFGLMRVTQAVLPQMRRQGEGLILNVSSMGGRIALPAMSLYHAAKFAVEGFSESLAYELDSQGIRVKLIEPGMVNTEFGGRSMELPSDPSLTAYQPYLDRTLAAFGAMSTPANSLSPQDVAAAIYAAAADDSARLRYPVGEDAEAMLRLRAERGDDDFRAQIRQTFA